MHTSTITSCALTVALLLWSMPASADIARGDDLEITDIYTNLDEWLDAAPEVTTIDFTGWEVGTQITNQYADLGVEFTNGFHFIHTASAFVDGFGVTNNAVFGTITMEFDQPLNVIGALFPGVLRFELFLDGEFVGWTEDQGCFPPVGCFAGLITEVTFDEVQVIDGSGSVSIDNLYFSFLEVPAPAAALPLFAAFGLMRLSRRRETM